MTPSLQVQATNQPFTPTADGWFQIAPYGVHPHPRGPQLLDQATAQALVNRWQSDGKQDLLIDFDHESRDPAKRTTAAGWVDNLEARAGGFYGHSRWSSEGNAALSNGIYRYVSPVWDTVPVPGKGDQVMQRPVRLLDLALTNQPRIRGIPLSNRDTPSIPNNPPKGMNTIAQLLGLPETATAEQIGAALQDLQAKLKTAQERVTALEAETGQMKDAQVTADIAANRDVIADEDSAKILLNSNRDAALKLFAKQREKLAKPADPAATETLANRDAKAPTTPASTKPLKNRATEQADAVEATRLANRCSFDEAWQLTRRQKPELFAEEAAAS